MNPHSELFLDPPPELNGRIMRHIIRYETRRRRFRFGISFVVFFLSVFGMRMVFHWISEDMAQSGFGAFVSLLFVDASVLTQSGKEFAYALLESLPALSMSLGGIFLIAGLISGWSLVTASRSILRLRQLSHE